MSKTFDINKRIKKAAEINLINMKKLKLMQEVYHESNDTLNRLLAEKTGADIVQDYDDKIRIDINYKNDRSHILSAKQLAELELLTGYTFTETLDTPGYYIFDKPEIVYPVNELKILTRSMEKYIRGESNE